MDSLHRPQILRDLWAMQANALVAPVRRPPMRVNIRYKVYPNDRDALPRDPAWHISTRFRNVGTVGTRSRAIRVSTSDDRVGCSASDGLCTPARPALHVSTRLLPFLPRTFASADCIGPLSIIAPPVNVLRRTRPKPSTIRGAAPDVVIGQSTAARAGARPYLGEEALV